MFMSRINEGYRTAMAMIAIRMIKNWTGTQEDLEKEIKNFIEIIYEDGQDSVTKDIRPN